jgi:flavin reductase (NADH)
LSKDIHDTFAWAEYAVSGTVIVGDPVIVLGEVTAVSRDADTPLLYGMRRYCAWPIDPAMTAQSDGTLP